jgi:hypothetical protein
MKYVYYLVQVSICLFLLACQNSVQHAWSYAHQDSVIVVSEAGADVLHFQIKALSNTNSRDRGGYVHPLFGLDGDELTEDKPEDHPHHRGVFAAWHQVLYKGNEIADTWVITGMHYSNGIASARVQDSILVLEHEHFWERIVDDKPSYPIVSEKTEIRLYPKRDSFRVLDFTIILKPLVEKLAIGGSDDAKGYGGFSWRMPLVDSMKFISGGQVYHPVETAIQAAKEMTVEATYKNRVGITVISINKTDTLGYPSTSQAWIIRDKAWLSMQNAVYPGRIPRLLPQSGLRLEYRMIIHRGNIDQHILD